MLNFKMVLQFRPRFFIIRKIFRQKSDKKVKLYTERTIFILCTVENLRIDEQDCGVDFFRSD